MAYIQRVIFVCALGLMGWLPAVSYAAFPATVSPPDFSGLSVHQAACQSTYAAACSLTVAQAASGASIYCSGAWRTGPGWCGEMRKVGGNQGQYVYAASWQTSGTLSCPSNSSLSGSSCTCSVGFTQVGSTCVDPNLEKCLAAAGGSDLYTGFSSITIGSSFCPSDGLRGCASQVTGGFAPVKNGVKTWTYEVTYSGSTCTPPTSGTVGAETDCKGTVGTVNGVTVCSPPSDQNTVESIKSTTSTNPVSAASAPGSGGSTTTQEATTCTGSKCSTTTTTTTTPVGGGAATVTVKTEDVPKDDYCRDNPRAIMCLTSSFGGACSGGFVCEGDAVQCATAREIHTRNCRMFDQDSPESLLYGTEKNKAGSQVANENVAISSANFDTSDAIGGSGSCITDKVVTVMGSPITIPFSGVCVHLAMLGNVLLTVSFLLAGRIFMRG